MKPIVRILALLLISALLMSLASVTLAHEEDADHPVVLVTEDGVTLPQDLAAGIVTITFQNETDVSFSPLFTRLNEGKTVDDMMAAMQAGPAGALSVVTILGMLQAEPGTSVNVTYDLLAGDYVLLNFAGQVPDIQPFTVAESEAEPAAAPEADVSVTLSDFAFDMPAELEAGEQVWEITNAGTQPHEIAVFRVDEKATLEGVTTAFMDVFMNTEEGQQPELPYEGVFLWTPMSPETSAWIELDLAPGNYVLICFIPDFTSAEMLPHFQHGMIKLVTVAEYEDIS